MAPKDEFNLKTIFSKILKVSSCSLQHAATIAALETIMCFFAGPQRRSALPPQLGPLTSGLSRTCLRRRGTLLRTIWDQWWQGENTLVAGVQEGACPLCSATVCSQAHILCVCPSLDHILKDQRCSIMSTSNRLPLGPQRQLVTSFLDMALHRAPLDVRVLWTGMFARTFSDYRWY